MERIMENGPGNETAGSAPAASADPFALPWESAPASDSAGAPGTDGDPAGSEGSPEEVQEAGSGPVEGPIGTEALDGMGLGVNAGDAAPYPRPAIPGGEGARDTASSVVGNADTPRKRGRPKGSKNAPKQGANAVSQRAMGLWGPIPTPAEAEGIGKAVTTMVRMPLKLAVKMRSNPAYDFDDKEAEEFKNAIRDYSLIRGDVFGFWLPEILLAVGTIPPLYMRWVMWQDPSGEALKVVKQSMDDTKTALKEGGL